MSVFRVYPNQPLPRPLFTPGTALGTPLPFARADQAALMTRPVSQTWLIAVGIAALLPPPAAVVPPALLARVPPRAVTGLQLPAPGPAALLALSTQVDVVVGSSVPVWDYTPEWVQQPRSYSAALIPAIVANPPPNYSPQGAAYFRPAPFVQEIAFEIAPFLSLSGPDAPLPQPPSSAAAYIRPAAFVQEQLSEIAPLIPVAADAPLHWMPVARYASATYPVQQPSAAGVAATLPVASSYVPPALSLSVQARAQWQTPRPIASFVTGQPLDAPIAQPPNQRAAYIRSFAFERTYWTQPPVFTPSGTEVFPNTWITARARRRALSLSRARRTLTFKPDGDHG